MKTKRWVITSIGLCALWACNDKRVETPTPKPMAAYHKYFQQTVINAADILFLVDNSSSMTDVQINLANNLPVFINILESLPTRPSLHIAVTTSDMGAGAFTSSVPGCMAPDLGNFVTSPRNPQNPVACTSNHLNAGEHFFIDDNNGATRNYTGDLATAFGCVAQVGANGCGFEHQLAAVRAALGDPAVNLPAPAGNDGFLRKDALLAVVWITNEDDCSAPPDSELFDPSQNTPSDPLGPLASFRCTEFGILCGGQKPPRQAAGPLMNCVSDDALAQSDPKHSLLPEKFFADYFQRVKGTPNHVLLAAVAAPTDPFLVVIDQQTGFPSLVHSCTSGNGTFGDPAVRLGQVIQSVGNLGTFASICQDSYADAMSVIATKLRIALGPQCIEGVLTSPPDYTKAVIAADKTFLSPSDIECTVEDIQYIGTPQQKTLRALPPCNLGGQASGACWAVVGDSAHCTQDSHARVVVCRNGFDPSNPAQPCPMGGPALEDEVTASVTCSTLP
jgi:hypothetical protein